MADKKQQLEPFSIGDTIFLGFIGAVIGWGGAGTASLFGHDGGVMGEERSGQEYRTYTEQARALEQTALQINRLEPVVADMDMKAKIGLSDGVESASVREKFSLQKKEWQQNVDKLSYSIVTNYNLDEDSAGHLLDTMGKAYGAGLPGYVAKVDPDGLHECRLELKTDKPGADHAAKIAACSEEKGNSYYFNSIAGGAGTGMGLYLLPYAFAVAGRRRKASETPKKPKPVEDKEIKIVIKQSQKR